MSEMYNQVSWMTGADQAILDTLVTTDLILSAAVIARNRGFDNDYIGERCREMTKRGLLWRDDKEGTPMYQLTELGQLVANRKFDPEEIEEQTRIEEN